MGSTLAIVGLVLAGLVGLYLLVNLLAARLSLSPFRIPAYLSPGMLGLPQETVEIPSGHALLRGWWVPVDEPKVAVIALHGYVMNRCEFVPLAPALHRERAACLFMDFRGQGRSGGKIVSLGVHEKEDVKAMAEWVRRRCPGVPIVILGSSMGAAAAVFAAAEQPDLAEGFILDGVYRSLRHAGKGWWLMVGGPWLNAMLHPTVWLGSWMLRVNPSKVSVEAVLPKLTGRPILFMNGDADPIVSVEDAKANHAAAGPLAKVEWFEGCGHGHGRFREPYRYQEIVIRELNAVIEWKQASPNESR